MARRKMDPALLFGICLVASLLSLDMLPTAPPLPSRGWRRRLQGDRDRPPAWARDHLLPLALVAAPSPEHETALFWHIPKSGGTTARGLFECLGQTLASRAGALPQFGHDRDAALATFQPWKGKSATYVNVDTSSPAGILRAAEMGLVASGMADVIIASDPALAAARLWDNAHRGRGLVLLRHPVDRLVSKFYYLQTATWERTYRPHWKNASVLQFARSLNRDTNFMVKKLAGKKNNEAVGEEDLRRAKRLLRARFVVGLTDRMEESARRFNVVLGIDPTAPSTRRCMRDVVGPGAARKNSNPHPPVQVGSPAWEELAAANALDLRLYDYALRLFKEQEEIIAAYAAAASAPRVAGIEDA